MRINSKNRIFSSFRDPAGYVFKTEGQIYRQINPCYIEIYNKIKKTELFETLMDKKMLLPFEEVEIVENNRENNKKIIKPINLPFISYPYEWSFSQIKDAALLTLDIHIESLKKGAILKDASIYNIQFYLGRPTFIDHLSFDLSEKYYVWPAYGQFCRHFLAPLTLMSYVNIDLGKLLYVYIDGIPLDLATNLLPMKCRLNVGLLMHLFLHARSQIKNADQGDKLQNRKKLTNKQMIYIAESLRRTINKLKWRPSNTEWGDYYQDTNYNEEAMTSKKEIVAYFLSCVSANTIWDLGGNTGEMSRIASGGDSFVISFDIDPAAVEKNYLTVKENGEKNLLPLLMDLNNPSADIGFAGKERNSLSHRGSADLLLALALIHHLSISNNLPFSYIAEYLKDICKWLIIEFVPKEDSQIQRLLKSREDIFENYNETNFEESFSEYFEIIKKSQIKDSLRTIYLMQR